MRWRHPERGLVPPGRLHPRGRVLGPDRADRALGAARGLRAARALDGRRRRARRAHDGRQPLRPPARASRASSPTSPRILAETGVDPAARLPRDHRDRRARRRRPGRWSGSRALKALGVRLAIDDFGTGYSSLSQLGRFPVDVLKIDRSFVQAMGESGAHPRGRGVVAAVITLAGAMDLVPVAEGVEREEQAEVLRALGCPSAQGYLFSAAARRGRGRAPDPRRPGVRRRRCASCVCDDAPALRALLRTYARARRPRGGHRRGGGRRARRRARRRACARTWSCSTSACRRSTASRALPAIRRAAPDARVVVLSGCDARGDRRRGARARRGPLRREARRRRGHPRRRAADRRRLTYAAAQRRALADQPPS